MSKRYFPQQYGDRKKAKLDVSISDHNFPLSQDIAGSSKEPEANTWGDDQDDMMLLIASQACEDVYNTLPDYSLCMKPPSTSTQLGNPGSSNSSAISDSNISMKPATTSTLSDPSSSNANATRIPFKKPNGLPSNILTTDLKDKCNRISSPLPGISSKISSTKTDQINLSDDLIFNDKIFQGQDTNIIYRQLLQFQEENAKLKSENGKLLEKCVTKEGESSILRTQLKTCQIAVDNARLDRIKAQERVQQEWTDKLQVVNSKMHDLRTQLDFKNLEIISAKEKVRLLESNKVKLTQVIVPTNDISYSERRNQSVCADSRLAANAVGAQTESANVLTLNTQAYAAINPLGPALAALTESSAQAVSLALSDSLRRHDTHTVKCRVYSTFHRIPPSIATDQTSLPKVCLDDFGKQVAILTAGGACDNNIQKIVNSVRDSLRLVERDLRDICSKMTNAFHREMDDKYLECSTYLHSIAHTDLLSGRLLFPQEQAILSRRLVATLPYILRDEVVHTYQEVHTAIDSVLGVIHGISTLLDSASCAIHYSGLLLATTILIQHLTINHCTTVEQQKTILEILKNMISSRPMPFVCCQVLEFLGKLIAKGSSVDQLCPGSVVGNLSLDYEQGVLWYKKDSCYLQVLLKQIEAALRCIQKQALYSLALRVTQSLILFYANFDKVDKEDRCDCHLMLTQTVVFALRICAGMVADTPHHSTHNALVSVCRSGLQLLYQCSLKDPEFVTRLGHEEGHLLRYVQCMANVTLTECYSNMLSELSSSFQCSPEEVASHSRLPWLNSFDSFAIADC